MKPPTPFKIFVAIVSGATAICLPIIALTTYQVPAFNITTFAIVLCVLFVKLIWLYRQSSKQLRPHMTAVIIAIAVIFSGLILGVAIWRIPLAIPTVVAVVLFVVFSVVTAITRWFPRRKYQYLTNFDTKPRSVARRALLNKPTRTTMIPRTVARRALPDEPIRTTTIENFLNKLAEERPIRFLPQQLAEFTQNFTVKLGSGAFGSVYKGELPDQKPIAVKVLVGIMDKRMEEQFMAEVGTIAGTQHINLVRLYGFCYDDTLIAQVYEFMENGSLDKFLFNEDDVDTLQENDRKVIEFGRLNEIAIGAAKGIRYLHEECQRRIIHYDIKPGNILLDANFNPKVADFGLAKLMGREYTHMSMTGMRGTPGYAAPEMWLPYSPVTYKCDVYSFGMLLFEMVGRRKNFDCRAAESEKKWFPKLVYKQWDSGMLGEVMAARGIEQKAERERAVRMCKVALWCVQYSAEARPSMSKVLQMLEGEIEIEPPPNPFTGLYVSDVPDSHLSGGISNSNDLQSLLPV
ncbi:G-type lectin S-receptor-like serine/threonine-protein kinase SD2-5 isoform X1 [Zingiber officinale]|uniref:G-type lectin S-receptor-like serine/threonine-protein kinase SD2-5 isoform X1 n=1 Tax=Zingiber officinale TaxID=94328 RepID=UPI001C4B34D7|nr:G-type lectin S-receptor-like serine/threonine-protein kinase SD2-5 isoform X1 [Zingiber officinale]